MTKEQPYEVLNTLQNHIAGPGQNAYMKGCFAPASAASPGIPRALLPRVFARLVALSAPEAYTFGLLFEYFPLARVNAVPDDATAYRRGLAPNVLCVVYAKEEGEEAFRYSRDAAHELTGMISGTQGEEIGYGNYSAFCLPLFALCACVGGWADSCLQVRTARRSRRGALSQRARPRRTLGATTSGCRRSRRSTTRSSSSTSGS